MKIIDISLPISPEMKVWPGAPKTEFAWRRSMTKGDRSNNSSFSMNAHSGTHVDAPLHFFSDGKSVDQLPLEVLVGPAWLVDLSKKNEVSVGELERCWPKEEKVTRLLLKTRNSNERQGTLDEFRKDFCALRPMETRWLLNQGVQLVGIDAPSIQCFGEEPLVHQLFLQQGVVILEGLQLSGVSSGRYELFCLPLKLSGLEGAPARVLLRNFS